jgi:zinc/manganese transport system substrate-binding protein
MKGFFVILVLCLHTKVHAKAKIVTTFSVLEDIAVQLAEGDIEVANLVKGGIDPHLFEPGPRDIKQLRDAKILIANGLHFEPWLDRLIKSGPKNLVVNYASRTIVPRKLIENGLQVEDPHAWNSPRELIAYIKVVAEDLGRVFPQLNAVIQKRSLARIGQIEAIDSQFTRHFAEIHPSKRVILTTHDAAGYLAKAYNIKSISPIGLSTSEDFKTADLSVLLSQIMEFKIKMIFTEPSHHKILSERLAKKANLKLGPELFLDGLSLAGGSGDTIEKMLNHNLNSVLNSMK